MLPEGGTLPGHESGLLSKHRNELSQETHALTKQEILLGRGARAESIRVREPRRMALVSFQVTGLASRLSLASHLAWPVFGLTQGSFLVVCLSAKMEINAKDLGGW